MGNGSTPFYLTPEAPQYAALASYYGTPTVSMRNALWSSGEPAPATASIVSSVVAQSDGSTPLTAAHRTITDSLVLLTQRTAMDLQVLPFGQYDDDSIAYDLPAKPVYAGAHWGVCVCGRTTYYPRSYCLSFTASPLPTCLPACMPVGLCHA